MSVDYYFRRHDGAYLCVTNKPYHLPIAFPDGNVPARSGSRIYAALAHSWPEMSARHLIAKTNTIERFLSDQPGELLSEYDVHGMPTPVETIGRDPDPPDLERAVRAVGAPQSSKERG